MHYVTAGSLLDEFRSFCDDQAVPFEAHRTLHPPDDTTLFCIAGMQRYKALFRDVHHRGTVANVQRCLRVEDLEEVGDGLHWLSFDMLGLFSFREMTIRQAIDWWMAFLSRIGITPDVVTVHPDRGHWTPYYDPHGVPVQLDEDCRWSDGDIVGYCTEFFVGDTEIGNIVNPLGTCIDVGFGLDRLALVLGDPIPSTEELWRRAVLQVLDDGVRPSNKGAGYVLRRMLRHMVRRAIPLDHPEWTRESERQERARQRYRRLLPKHPHQPPEWWWDTHGIDVKDYRGEPGS
ncbi:MAG: hypothetical protein KTR31_24165 [Myxococcales bacterium]|nr:hypothetical protein [Myxococcales bacterium]